MHTHVACTRMHQLRLGRSFWLLFGSFRLTGYTSAKSFAWEYKQTCMSMRIKPMSMWTMSTNNDRNLCPHASLFNLHFQPYQKSQAKPWTSVARCRTAGLLTEFTCVEVEIWCNRFERVQRWEKDEQIRESHRKPVLKGWQTGWGKWLQSTL